ncbi:MAG: hypothetical protein KatS3mg129_2032 [Leptospiraceae bacterium]|nr:MAG: hypothetical protein KatS3mg129_2032 [Leptospiraceae bacterium]
MKSQKIFLFLLLLPKMIFSETIVEGLIWNGTKGQYAKPEKIEIIELSEEGMNPIKTFQEPGEIEKQFRIVLKNQRPVLIRVHYKGESYIELINTEDLKKKIVKKKIIVYDTTNNLKQLKINTGFQVTKYSDGLEINMIYAIQNKTIPPQTISGDKILFSLPENAKIIQASLTHEKSQMPVRVNLIEKNGYYILDKNIKPGNTELLIQVELSNYIYKKRIDPVLQEIQKQEKSSDKILSVFMWRPEDVKPNILDNSATIEEKNVPNLGKAYFIYYQKPEIILDFSKGSSLFKNPMKAYRNPIFDTSYKTIFALLSGIFIIFLIIPIIATSGIRITKNA